MRIERARARRVRATSARLGLLSLPLLIMAVGDRPLALHDRAARRPPLVDSRSGCTSSAARSALALVTYKVAESGRARLARGLDPARFFTDGLSLILAALAVPLLVTGVVLIVAPGSELGDRLRAPDRAAPGG